MKVRISGAPGYADFEGELLIKAPRVDGVPLSIIGYETELGRDVAVIEDQYIEEVAE